MRERCNDEAQDTSKDALAAGDHEPNFCSAGPASVANERRAPIFGVAWARRAPDTNINIEAQMRTLTVCLDSMIERRPITASDCPPLAARTPGGHDGLASALILADLGAAADLWGEEGVPGGLFGVLALKGLREPSTGARGERRPITTSDDLIPSGLFNRSHEVHHQRGAR